jgi:hypothetical protein
MQNADAEGVEFNKELSQHIHMSRPGLYFALQIHTCTYPGNLEAIFYKFGKIERNINKNLSISHLYFAKITLKIPRFMEVLRKM